MDKTSDRLALIGAGPMGLAAAKLLAGHGIAFQGFELHSDVGGLWDIDGPRSTMYETAHLISSRRMTEFADFPMALGVIYDDPRPTFEQSVIEQNAKAAEGKDANLAKLLGKGQTWTVEG